MAQSRGKKQRGGLVGGYEREALSLFARFTTKASNVRAILINDMIKSLKLAGVWDRLDALYIMAAETAQAAQRNWIADQFNLSEVSSPTFATDRGYTGNGTSSYLNTSLTPGSSAQYARNSAMLAVWCRTNTTPAGASFDIGQGGGASSSGLTCKSSTGALNGYLNGSTAVSQAAIATGVGFAAVDRADASTIRLYKTGSQLTTAAVASAALNTSAPYSLLAVNGINQFSANQLAAAAIGSSLNDVQHTAFYNAVNTYLTAVGAA